MAFAQQRRLGSVSRHLAGGAEQERQQEAEFEPEPLRIIIAGPPASGKGTQCENIVLQFDVVHLSTGDMLRAAVKAGSELGKQVRTPQSSCQLQ
jgi:hypothetical protein